MTQIEKVAAHLMSGKTITPVTAMAVYGISRLSSCIEDLRRHRGLSIDTVLKRDEAGKQYGEYRLRRDIEVGDKVQVKPGHGYGLPHWVRSLRSAEVIDEQYVQETYLGSDPEMVRSVLVRFKRNGQEKDIWMVAKELTNVG